MLFGCHSEQRDAVPDMKTSLLKLPTDSTLYCIIALSLEQYESKVPMAVRRVFQYSKRWPDIKMEG
jgi:hypothetical protein